MFGKNSKEYVLYKKYKNDFDKLGKNIEVVALGSTMAYYDYDFSLWNEKGAIFAAVPQTVSYDFKVLKKYASNLKKGCIVILNLAEFTFLVKDYADDKRNHKYYFYLDSKDINNYSKIKKVLLKHVPGIMDISLIKDEISSVLKGRKRKQMDFVVNCEKIATGWIQEFRLDKDTLDEKYADIQKDTFITVKEMISFIKETQFKPVIVIPPIASSLKEFLPKEVLNECLWKCINELSKECMIIDCYHDETLCYDELYDTPIILNSDGKRFFNKKIQNELGLEVDMQEKSVNYKIGEIEIPWISFGTGVIWKYTRNPIAFMKYNVKEVLSSIIHRKWNRELYGNLHIDKILDSAYEEGFRMFDSGRIYAYSEAKLGRLKRKNPEICLTTKCSVMDIERETSPNSVAGNIEISKQYLNEDVIDIYMLHWPEGDKWTKYYMDIYEEYKKGKCKVFGGCNMELKHLQMLEQNNLPLPMIIQTELHPLNSQMELREYCTKHGIQLMAHTPTARFCEEIRESNILKKISEKYLKSIPQIIIRWHYQNKVIPVVSTFDRNHMRENLDIFDFELTSTEMMDIDNMNIGKKLISTEGIDDPKYIYNL